MSRIYKGHTILNEFVKNLINDRYRQKNNIVYQICNIDEDKFTKFKFFYDSINNISIDEIKLEVTEDINDYISILDIVNRLRKKVEYKSEIRFLTDIKNYNIIYENYPIILQHHQED